MSTPRDDQLGAALRALDVPAHGPDFWADLADRLRAEAAGRTDAAEATPAADVPPKEGGAPDGAETHLDAPIELEDRRARRRAGASGGRSRVDGASSPDRRRWLATAAVAALVAAVVGAATLLPDARERTRTLPPADDAPTSSAPTTPPTPTSTSIPPAPAAPVPESLRAEVTVTLDDGSVRDLLLLAARDGSRNLFEEATGARTVIDAVAGEVVEVPPTDGSGAPTAYRTRSLPPGGPGARATDAASAPELVDHLLALVAAGDPSVTTAEVLGRPAWRLETAVTPNKLAGGGPDAAVVVVDKATTLLLLLEETAGEALFRRIEVTSLMTSDQALERTTFQVDGDAELFDEGFTRLAVDGDPLLSVGDSGVVPQAVPPGFELAVVAVHPGEGGSTGAEGSNPVSVDAVVLTYRRGWEQLVVTSRRTGADPGAWGDPFGGEGQVVESTEALVVGGDLASTEVEVVLDAATVPHLWGVHPDVVITVSGPLTAEQLLDVAGSLRRAG